MTFSSDFPVSGRFLTTDEADELRNGMTMIIEASHLFASLGDEDRELLISQANVVRYQSGDLLMREGDVGNDMLMLMSGRVRVSMADNGRTVELAQLGPGACIGEVSVLTGKPRTASIEAMSEVKAAAFAKHRIERVLDARPELRDALMAVIATRAEDAIQKIIYQYPQSS